MKAMDNALLCVFVLPATFLWPLVWVRAQRAYGTDHAPLFGMVLDSRKDHQLFAFNLLARAPRSDMVRL